MPPQHGSGRLLNFCNMRQYLYAFILALALVSCGTDSRHFKIDGRLLHLNQGEFYVYSPDGALHGVDTIKVAAGRFSKEISCDREMTLMVVFPNFTEQPIFARPGKSVDVKGDASHLKEMTVKGTKDNELMNGFRQQIANASPPEALKYARQFVEDHPESPVSVYLTRRYFVATAAPDYATARRLVQLMLPKQPDNGALHRLQRMAAGVPPLRPGDKVPRFAATDIDGRSVGTATLTRTPFAVVCAWASWSYESIDRLRQLLQLQKDSGGALTVVSVCLDPAADTARRLLKQNGFTCTTVCDGQMIDGRMYRALGMFSIPDNVLVHNGRIVGTGMSYADISKQVRK